MNRSDRLRFHVRPNHVAIMEELESRLLLSGSIEGRVYDYTSHAALASVKVTLWRNWSIPDDPSSAPDQGDGALTASANTDANGYYHFTNIEARHYRMQVEDGAVVSSQYYLGAAIADAAVVDLQSTKGENFNLRRAGVLWGYVRDAAGQPVKRGEVVVDASYTEDDSGWHTASIDSTGKYQVYLAPTDQAFYPVQVSTAYNPGSTYKLYGSNSDTAFDGNNNYRDDPTTQGFTYLGSATGTHTFTGGYTQYLIRADLGNIVAVASVQTNQAFNSSGASGARSEGKVVILGDPGGAPSFGSYELGYASATSAVTINIVNKGYASTPTWFGAQLAPGLYAASLTGTHGPDFTLGAGGLIVGRFTDSSGHPLSNVRVHTSIATAQGMVESPATDTAEDGTFRLPCVPANTNVYIRTPDTDAWDGQTVLAGPRLVGPFKLTSNQTLNVGDITFNAPGTVHGVVTNSSGTPISGADVTVQGVDAQNGYIDSDDISTETDENGAYTLQVPAGQMYLQVSADGYRRYVATSRFAIASNGTVARNVTMTSMGTPVTVTGQISNFATVGPRNSAGVALPFRDLIDYDPTILPSDMGVGAAEDFDTWTTSDFLSPNLRIASFSDVEDSYDDYFATNSNGGKFSLEMPAGTFDVFATRWRQMADGSEFDLVGDPITVTGAAGQSLSGKNPSISVGTGTVKGKVTFPVGFTPPAHTGPVVVWLIPAGHKAPRAHCEPAVDGNFTISDLPAGTYTILAGGMGLNAYTSSSFTVTSGQITTVNAAFTFTNHAPVLDNTGNMSLAAISEDATANDGTSISALLASAGNRIADSDIGAQKGIAIVAADTTNGAWQYTINGGIAWTTFTPSYSTARLLAADANTRIRFVPKANYNGTISSAITFRAWDTTGGSNGGTVSTATTGGTTAFSTATETASLVVTPVNDAPVLDNTGSMTLNKVVVGQTNAGTRIADLLASAGGDRVTDVDASAKEGIAVVGVDATNGTWQYSLNGTTWVTFTAYYSSARLLASTAYIRFVPKAGYTGTVASGITFRAWDQTSGVNGSTLNALTAGGSTSLSAAVETASVLVSLT